jgi:hypothetical protein
MRAVIGQLSTCCDRESTVFLFLLLLTGGNCTRYLCRRWLVRFCCGHATSEFKPIASGISTMRRGDCWIVPLRRNLVGQCRRGWSASIRSGPNLRPEQSWFGTGIDSRRLWARRSNIDVGDYFILRRTHRRTSVARLRLHRSTIAACFVVWRKIIRTAFCDFCNTICH